MLRCRFLGRGLARVSLCLSAYLVAVPPASVRAQDSSAPIVDLAPKVPTLVLDDMPWALRQGSTPTRKVQTKSDGEWGTVTSQVTLNDFDPASVWDDQVRQRAWKRDDSWRYSLTGQFFVFGQLGANSDEAAQADAKVNGRTGVACKLPLSLLGDGEVQLRSGPSLTYTDPFRTDRTREKSEWLLEVQGRLSLVAGVGLEYEGSMIPALTPYDKQSINQDIRLAFPLGDNGKFKLGAKRHWESFLQDARSGTDSTELYFGIELSR